MYNNQEMKLRNFKCTDDLWNCLQDTVVALDTDKSKFIRSALKEKLIMVNIGETMSNPREQTKMIEDMTAPLEPQFS